LLIEAVSLYKSPKKFCRKWDKRRRFLRTTNRTNPVQKPLEYKEIQMKTGVFDEKVCGVRMVGSQLAANSSFLHVHLVPETFFLTLPKMYRIIPSGKAVPAETVFSWLGSGTGFSSLVFEGYRWNYGTKKSFG
jgi:hypothetical protein